MRPAFLASFALLAACTGGGGAAGFAGPHPFDNPPCRPDVVPDGATVLRGSGVATHIDGTRERAVEVQLTLVDVEPDLYGGAWVEVLDVSTGELDCFRGLTGPAREGGFYLDRIVWFDGSGVYVTAIGRLMPLGNGSWSVAMSVWLFDERRVEWSGVSLDWTDCHPL